jgi:hypothetical protein
LAFSLYAAIVPSYRQILGAVAGLTAKAEAFCTEQGIAPQELIQARLAPDMLPFAYQVKSTAVHSLGAIEGVRRGVFCPDRTAPPETFAALQARIAETLTALAAIDAAEINGFLGRDMRFAFGDRRSACGLRRGEFPAFLLAAQFLFPRHDGLRHPALERGAVGQARFHGTDALETLDP